MSRGRGGFSLVELLIVVSLIGVLAAIAIPSFLRYQLRARSAEAATNLKAIATSEEAYFSEYGTYVSVSSPVPAALPSGAGSPWSDSGQFDVLGWGVEGNVRFQYQVGADTGAGSAGLVRFTAEARGDIDGDGNPSFWAFVKPVAGVGGLDGSFPETSCTGTGVYHQGSPGALELPGPCDRLSGRSVF